MAPASLRFDRFELQREPALQARAALRDLAPATQIDFELNLTHRSGLVKDQVVLNRQVRFALDGLVRRRAVYMWRSFHHFKPTVSYYFCLQKISGGGATWLPASLTNGWIVIGE